MEHKPKCQLRLRLFEATWMPARFMSGFPFCHVERSETSLTLFENRMGIDQRFFASLRMTTTLSEHAD
jgi:hypothetical protein